MKTKRTGANTNTSSANGNNANGNITNENNAGRDNANHNCNRSNINNANDGNPSYIPRDDEVPIVTLEDMEKTAKIIAEMEQKRAAEGKDEDDKGSFMCPICRKGQAEYSRSMCFDVVLSGEYIIIPNLSGNICNNCGEEFYDARSSHIIDRYTRDKVAGGHEATISVTGGGRLGIYLPNDILRAMNLKAKERLIITPISKKKMIVEVEE